MAKTVQNETTLREWFTLDGLRLFLEHTRRIASVTPLGQWDGRNAVLLRHDVDFSLEAAHDVSRLEKACGVRTTFCLMVKNPAYDLSAIANRALVREMAGEGFEIGLHFDPSVYGSDELAQRVQEEAAILEELTEHPVRSLSLHNPAEYGDYVTFEGYCNAYDEAIFSDAIYLSDSNRNLRNKDPFEFVKKACRRHIQVLLHPLYYCQRTSPVGDARPVPATRLPLAASSSICARPQPASNQGARGWQGAKSACRPPFAGRNDQIGE